MSGTNWGNEAAAALARVAERVPLIHHITNIVVTNDVANITLAFGASPVMAYAPEEVAEMAALAGALALNIGTLSRGEIDAGLAGLAAPIVCEEAGLVASLSLVVEAERLDAFSESRLVLMLVSAAAMVEKALGDSAFPQPKERGPLLPLGEAVSGA